MRADDVPSGNWDCAPLLSKASPGQTLGTGHVSKEGCTGCKKSSPGLLVPSLCSEFSVYMGLGDVEQEVFLSLCRHKKGFRVNICLQGFWFCWFQMRPSIWVILYFAVTCSQDCRPLLYTSVLRLRAVDHCNYTHQNQAKMQTLWPCSKPIHPTLFLNETPRNIRLHYYFLNASLQPLA